MRGDAGRVLGLFLGAFLAGDGARKSRCSFMTDRGDSRVFFGTSDAGGNFQRLESSEVVMFAGGMGHNDFGVHTVSPHGFFVYVDSS